MSDSQPFSQKQIDAEALIKLNEAIGLLHDWGLPTRVLVEALGQRIDDQSRQPTEDDHRWPWSPPENIDEHLSFGDSRPILSCALVVGRCYSLTPGQRDYVRERFNMTPAPLVRVTEVALYPGTQLIRRVTLVSELHVDPKNRRRMMTRFVLDRWGEFCTQAKANDEARRMDDVVDDDDNQPAKRTKAEKSAKPRKLPTLDQLFNEYGL